MYTEQQLVGIAKRENNNLRKYLVLNKLQGKHVPVRPKDAFAMFDALAEEVGVHYKGESLLLVGFAETATAIGARLSIKLGTWYIQTTREAVPEADYLYFTESHSHATEQKLVRQDIDHLLQLVERIVFVEDEVTTGNTIQKIIDIMRKTYSTELRFSVASLLNGMDEDALKRYEEQNIQIHYLVKTNHASYTEIAEGYAGTGVLLKMDGSCSMESVEEQQILNYVNTRRRVQGSLYAEKCVDLWQEIQKRITVQNNETVLVLGTEEFMYPALFVGECFEKNGVDVRCHATTRSPILTSDEEGYPLHKRYELVSFYDADRTTFIYDLKRYDKVLIITDAMQIQEQGKRTLLQALEQNGCKDIVIIQWKGE